MKLSTCLLWFFHTKLLYKQFEWIKVINLPLRCQFTDVFPASIIIPCSGSIYPYLREMLSSTKASALMITWTELCRTRSLNVDQSSSPFTGVCESSWADNVSQASEKYSIGGPNQNMKGRCFLASTCSLWTPPSELRPRKRKACLSGCHVWWESNSSQ